MKNQFFIFLGGKFSQKSITQKTELIRDAQRAFELYLDNTIEISRPIILNENCMRLIYKDKKEYLVENKNSNIIVSLWLVKLKKIVLYFLMEINLS